MIVTTPPFSQAVFPLDLDQPHASLQLSGVIPAKAGTQYSAAESIVYWIPAFAGTTGEPAAAVRADMLREHEGFEIEFAEDGPSVIGGVEPAE